MKKKHRFKIHKKLRTWFYLIGFIIVALWVVFLFQYLQEQFDTPLHGLLITTGLLVIVMILGILKPRFITKEIQRRL